MFLDDLDLDQSIVCFYFSFIAHVFFQLDATSLEALKYSEHFFFFETSRSMDFHKTCWRDGGIWEQLTLIVILGRCTVSPPSPA